MRGSFRDRLGCRRRRCSLDRGRRFLLLDQCFEHISRTGNVREVDLRLNALGLAGSRFCARAVALSLLAEMSAYLFCFVAFEGAGVRLLGGHARHHQGIQYGFALDFQFSRQIVDSNLAHPPLHSSLPVKRSSQPHGFQSSKICSGPAYNYALFPELSFPELSSPELRCSAAASSGSAS